MTVMAPELLPPPAEDAHSRAERQRLNWRMKTFAEHGLDHTRALDASLGAIDLHEYADLIKGGCDPTTAYDILR